MITAAIKQKLEEGISSRKSLDGASRPCTPPPSSQLRVSQKSDIKKEVSKSSNSTPSKGHQAINSSPTMSPMSKRKRSESTSSTPTKSRGQKWEDWEDLIIWKSIVAVGEQGTNWHDILSTINEGRDEAQARTFIGLKRHWIDRMKPMLIH